MEFIVELLNLFFLICSCELNSIFDSNIGTNVEAIKELFNHSRCNKP